MENYPLPPIVEILLDCAKDPRFLEGAWLRDSSTLRMDLQDQADATLKTFEFADRTDEDAYTGKFVVALTGALDPFSDEGKCISPACRVRTAEGFGRSLPLYCDSIFVPEPFSETLLESDTWSQPQRFRFFASVLVLQALEPLIRAGIVRFSSGFISFCSDCHAEFSERVNLLVEELSDHFERDVKVELRERSLYFNSGDLFGSHLSHYLDLDERKYRRLRKSPRAQRKVALQSFRDRIFRQVHGTMVQAETARRLGALLGGASRIEAASILSYESSARIDYAHRLALKGPFTVPLPWIDKISMSQVLELKDTASDALAILREQLAACCVENREGARSLEDLVADLRIQTEEIAADLRNLKGNRSRKFIRGASITTIAFTLCGVSTGIVDATTSLPALLSLLSLLHRDEDQAAHKGRHLKSKPAYALLRARELQCRD